MSELRVHIYAGERMPAASVELDIECLGDFLPELIDSCDDGRRLAEAIREAAAIVAEEAA